MTRPLEEAPQASSRPQTARAKVTSFKDATATGKLRVASAAETTPAFILKKAADQQYKALLTPQDTLARER